MHKIKMFFYGSLMTYPPRGRWVVRKVNATIPGYLYRFNGYFPALVIGDESTEDTVKGMLVEYIIPSDRELEYFFLEMDGWEGYFPHDDRRSAYFRVTAKVLTEHGTWEEAQMYIINEHSDVKSLIKWEAMENGDFLTWRDKRYGKSNSD